ncbi:Sterol carrier protein domain containing protein [Actinobacteria bacterium OV450]|nr:Sterol carrier protein domain containing protein [Actinobacteria bacterium OV450]
MTDRFTVRVLGDGDLRSAAALNARAMHIPAPTDAAWEHDCLGYESGRTFGVEFQGALAGTMALYASQLAVPGGTVPIAAATKTGVLPHATRRGLLRSMFFAAATDVAARGEAALVFYPTEAVIYRRIGAGPATRARAFTVDARRGAFHPDAPVGGEVRPIAAEDALTALASIHQRIWAARPGGIRRPSAWTEATRGTLVTTDSLYAVHVGPDGPDGYVRYKAARQWSYEQPEVRATIDVHDLHAGNAEASAGLWRFLLGLDLARQVQARERPVDEPMELLLNDPAACHTKSVTDELWIRLTDVAGALSARTYGHAEPVVIGVQDPWLPDNQGSYHVSPEGVLRTMTEPDLVVGVADLASLYLGNHSASTLAATGRLHVIDPTALPHADRLFASTLTPWCGSHF